MADSSSMTQVLLFEGISSWVITPQQNCTECWVTWLWVDHRWLLVRPKRKPVLWRSRSKYRCVNLAKTRGRCQPFGANSKISYKVGDWQLSPPLRREAAAAGPPFPIGATTLVTGRFDVDPNLLFHPSFRRGQRKGPYKVLQGKPSPRRVVKYSNKLLDSVVMVPSINGFKERVDRVWTVFPHLPVKYWTLIFQIF